MQMDKATLSKQFDACLMTDAEIALGMEAWESLPDPFPTWGNIEQKMNEAA